MNESKSIWDVPKKSEREVFARVKCISPIIPAKLFSTTSYFEEPYLESKHLLLLNVEMGMKTGTG